MTERDVRQGVGRRGADDSETRVGDICDREAFVVEMSIPLDEVLRHMASRQVEAAMVVKDGKLAGIFTRTDACQRFAEYLRAWAEEDDDDVA